MYFMFDLNVTRGTMTLPSCQIAAGCFDHHINVPMAISKINNCIRSQAFAEGNKILFFDITTFISQTLPPPQYVYIPCSSQHGIILEALQTKLPENITVLE